MTRVRHSLCAGLSVALLATFATTGSLAAQTLLAEYPLIVDTLDATGLNAPIMLTGNPTPPNPPANGVCVNGIYSYNSGGQDVRTPILPNLTTADFQFAVEFEIAAMPAVRAPILMGGHLWRWLGLYVQANGVLGIKHNNSNYAWSNTTLTTNQWYSAVVKCDAGVVQVFLDDVLVMQTVVGVLSDGSNLNFTTNDFSNGLNHNGCIRNLRIWNDANLEFHRAPTGCNGLTLTEAGTTAAGGTVNLTVGGPFTTAAIVFGFAPTHVPLCPPATCVLGVRSVGAIPGSTASLTIPMGLPSGASVLFQGIAISPNGCLFAGAVNIAVTETVHALIL